MIEELLPASVSAVESFIDPGDAVLLPEEEPAVARAVDRRRREYTTVRHCARAALARIGVGPVPILSGVNGAPCWPAGVRGSMTHCDGYRAAVVGRDSAVLAIGIDAEPHHRLPDGVAGIVMTQGERERFRELSTVNSSVHWDRILFAAKESVYKAWSPVTGRWLDFDQVDVVVDPFSGVFVARVLAFDAARDPGGLRVVRGRWLVRGGFVLTAVTVPADSVRPVSSQVSGL